MNVNADTLKQLLAHYHDDQDMIDTILDALESFEQYHAAIYALEIRRKLYAAGAMDSETYREEIPARDKTRTVHHNAVLTQVNILNRMAGMAGLPPFYDGVVSEERPYRREVANAVLAFVEQVILNRG